MAYCIVGGPRSYEFVHRTLRRLTSNGDVFMLLTGDADDESDPLAPSLRAAASSAPDPALSVGLAAAVDALDPVYVHAEEGTCNGAVPMRACACCRWGVEK